MWSEYRFDIGVESLMSQGLQLKKLLKKNNEKEKGTGLGGGHQILLQETSYKLILIDRALFTVCP